jgi:flagellar FliL protein
MSEDIPDDEIETVAAPAAKSGGIPYLPLIIVLLVVPIITIVGMELVVIPKLTKSLATQAEDAAKAPTTATQQTTQAPQQSAAAQKAGAKSNTLQTYLFEDMISNLSGTMGTRFLKTSFEVTSYSENMRNLIRDNRAQVHDAVMGVMSSRTIKELEAVGGRNALRVSLIEAINRALGVSIIEELFFVDLIIQ